MSWADIAARALTPALFLLWGFVLGIPRAYAEPHAPDGSWWQRPWMFAGIPAIAVGLYAFPFSSKTGEIALFAILLIIVPLALGGAAAWWLRRKPSRAAGTAASPHPTDSR